MTTWVLLIAVLVLTSACGLVFGDDQHWFPGPFFRMGAALVVGVALGYGAHRLRVHERREERRERREE